MKNQIRLTWTGIVIGFMVFLSACSSNPTYTLEEQVWVGATVIKGPVDEYADAITVAPTGHVYVAGHEQYARLILSKLNGSGLKLWTKYFGSLGMYIEKIAADTLGNSFVVTKRTIFQVNLEPGQFIFTLHKFAPNGTQLWQKDIATINSPDISAAYTIVPSFEFDGAGTIFLPIIVHDVGRAGPYAPQIEYGLLMTFDPVTGNTSSSFRWDNNYANQSRKIVDARVRQQAGVAGEWLLLEQVGFASAFERRSANGTLIAEQTYGGYPLKIASVTTEPFAVFTTDVGYTSTCIAVPITTCKTTFARYLDNSVINSDRNEVSIIRRDGTQGRHGERYRITGTTVTLVNTYPEPVPFATEKIALNKNSAIFSAGYFWNGQNADIQIRKFNARGVQF